MTETQKETAAEAVFSEGSILDQIIDETRMIKQDSQRDNAKDMIGEFVQEVMAGAITTSKNTEAMINDRIAQLDKLISSQLNEVMHHPDLQELEGTWRGLHYLTDKSETGQSLKIRVLNATKKDVLKDMERASEFDQSAIWKAIYEEEFGTFGGDAYGLLVGDYQFTNHPQDLKFLEEISHVSAAAHAPFISSANAGMFNWDNFDEMSEVRDMAKIFDSAEYTKWTSFRESEDSRYVALALPHILMREPYGADTVPVESFNYEEDIDGTDSSKYLWGNAAYALATKMTDAFAKYRWCAAIRGVEGGGLVEGLPVHNFKTDEGDVALKCPTEIAITDRREKELADLGFIPLVHCKGTDKAAFFSTQSAQKAKTYDTDLANANASMSTQLQYIMATSRFAHYLKSMMRDKVGSFMTKNDAEKFLNNWIANYITLDPNAGQEMKAKYPLSEARVDVSEVPGKTGAYRAVAFLKPHYQLDELSVSLRMVAELPASKA